MTSSPVFTLPWWRARWPALAALVSVGVIASMHVTERVFGFAACELCLRQREVYWAVIAVAAVSALAWWRAPESRAAMGVTAVIGALFLTSAVLAGYHAGVEWKWWDGPPCGVQNFQIGNPFGEAAQNAPRAVPCDEAAFRILGLSLAGWNVVLSLILAGVSVAALRRGSAATLEPAHG